MPGLVPGIHVYLPRKKKKDVDGRDKPGHDIAPSLRGSQRKRTPLPLAHKGGGRRKRFARHVGSQ